MTPLQQFLIENTEPKISKRDLAKKLKVDASLITLWMQGTRKPGKAKLQRVSQVTGIPMDLL
jgi:transcriptional regulator with XRE-family HTH domain